MTECIVSLSLSVRTVLLRFRSLRAPHRHTQQRAQPREYIHRQRRTNVNININSCDTRTQKQQAHFLTSAVGSLDMGCGSSSSSGRQAAPSAVDTTRRDTHFTEPDVCIHTFFRVRSNASRLYIYINTKKSTLASFLFTIKCMDRELIMKEICR